MVYITAGSAGEGRAIGKRLVSERLVACVNMVENMHSMYWWKGAVQEEREVILIAKTKAALIPRLIDEVKSMHSYECPCIVSLPILEGHRPFLDWIAGETR
jgi:periplasmic divalent cation tolerance protein